jgi:hypothetical protein
MKIAIALALALALALRLAAPIPIAMGDASIRRHNLMRRLAVQVAYFLLLLSSLHVGIEIHIKGTLVDRGGGRQQWLLVLLVLLALCLLGL